MKKIYVLGNFSKNGIKGNDSDSLDYYMELGWEIFTTGFWAKLNLGPDDAICTISDRLFMYRNITNNLIQWEDLETQKQNFDEVIYTCHNMFGHLKVFNENDWSDEMRQRLAKNDFPTVDEENFACVQIRRRDHVPKRNGNLDHWEKIVTCLSKKYKKVYLVGKGNESCSFADNVEYASLEKYCSLIKSDGCKLSVGSSSGLMALNYLYGRKDLPVHILYTEPYDVYESGHILFFAEKTNVSGIKPQLHLTEESCQAAVFGS